MAEKVTSKDLIKMVDNDRLGEVVKMGQLKQLLNTEPPEAWLKRNDYTKTTYLPIDKVENLLDTIFQEWRVEIKSISQLAQSICAVVRVHYKDPINGEWSYHDGVGADPLQTDKGYTAADLAHIKSDAVQKAGPAAVSYAIKDATEHLGKIFGRDLNRKDTVAYSSAYKEDFPMEQAKAMLASLYRTKEGMTDEESKKKAEATVDAGRQQYEAELDRIRKIPEPPKPPKTREEIRAEMQEVIERSMRSSGDEGVANE